MESNGHQTRKDSMHDKGGIFINSTKKTVAETGGFPCGEYDTLMRDLSGMATDGDQGDLRSESGNSLKGKNVGNLGENGGATIHVGEPESHNGDGEQFCNGSTVSKLQKATSDHMGFDSPPTREYNGLIVQWVLSRGARAQGP